MGLAGLKNLAQNLRDGKDIPGMTVRECSASDGIGIFLRLS